MNLLCVLLIVIVVLIIICMLVDLLLYGCGINVQMKTCPEYYKNVITQNDIGKHYRIKEGFSQKVQKGKQHIFDKKVVIALLARDVSTMFDNAVKKTEQLGKQFDDYRIVIFENDSSDDSRVKIKKWARENKKVILLRCCDEGSCSCELKVRQLKVHGALNNKRIKKMAKFRNRCLDYIKKNFRHYDYMIVYDFDTRGGIFMDGFYSSFEDPSQWDIMCAMGLTYAPIFFGKVDIVYDTIAFIPKDHEKSKNKTLQLIQNFLQQQKILKNNTIGDNNVAVTSAFNGLAIYKIKDIIHPDVHYNCRTPCEHLDLHKSMKKIQKHRVFINPSMILISGLDNEPQMPIETFIGWFK